MSTTNFKSIINLLDEITYEGNSCLNIFIKYKLFETYKSNLKYFSEYTISEGDRWDTLSYKYYGTFELWWVIAIFNNVVNPFETMQVGQIIQIIQPQYLTELLLALRAVHRNK